MDNNCWTLLNKVISFTPRILLYGIPGTGRVETPPALHGALEGPVSGLQEGRRDLRRLHGLPDGVPDDRPSAPQGRTPPLNHPFGRVRSGAREEILLSRFSVSRICLSCRYKKPDRGGIILVIS